ncbi:PucR family transcriptional regulator [Streptomyces sp. G45]|uniref:PucR family transcriptional regulator n=1 Tax=Streptomyces sp. G45 TaxID=3406627 RepID=UPI003C1B58C0
MGDLFAELARNAAANARREVETYAREIPELARLDAHARSQTLAYAVWLRRRTGELAPDNAPLTEADLAHIAAMGSARAEAGVSSASRRHILRLHTALMLREVNEAADAQSGGAAAELVRLMCWFGPQGERGISAYERGFVSALRRRLPYAEQVALLTRALLTGDPLATELAEALGTELSASGWYAVTVVRVPGPPGADLERAGAMEALAKAHQVPVAWRGDGGAGAPAGELIALVPVPGPDARTDADAEADAGGGDPPPVPGRKDDEEDPVRDLVRDVADALGRPCAAGTALAPAAELADGLDRARRISAAAPLRRASALTRAHTLADVHAELALGEVPFVDTWLHAVGRRLDPGPDLVVTLDAYYRHDMNRATTAAALNVHPRTLDYRLRRVRELTGLAPASTRGVRVLSSVVTRRLSGAWG